MPARGRLFAAVAFLGAFLLFTLELVFAKRLLPLFGGAAYVWTVASMVFQGLLLAGYLYAQAALARLGAAYRRAHAVLLLLPLFFFPLGIRGSFAGLPPSARLIVLLLCSVGAPFAVLATTSPVVQDWLRRAGLPESADSYVVFGASNAGALAALLAYPFLIEPRLTVRQQLLGWEGLYVVYALLHWRLRPRAEATFERSGPPPRSSVEERLIWAGLALGPSAAMLAATNLLTLDLAALPLVWIAPLGVYLATLVLSFKRRPWYPKRLSLTMLGLILGWFAVVASTALLSAGVPSLVVIRRLWVVNRFLYYNAALFVLGLACHRSLALSKPPAERSAQFYVWLAAGGWLGAVLVSLLLPVLLRHIAVPEADWAVAGALSIGALLYRDTLARRQARLEERGPTRPVVWALAFVGALGLVFFVWRSPAVKRGNVLTLRNFYGWYRVADEQGLRGFYHGETLHGMQSLDPARQDEPLLYFARSSPIAGIFADFGPSARRVGVMGLGAGELAAYGRAGQELDFYELDPDVIDIARTMFTYLARSKAAVRVIPGDARLSLAADRGAPFGLLAMDVFSGGAIPVHMITREALALYFSRMTPDGVLVVQVTNRFLDLRPMFAALAREDGYLGCAKLVWPRKKAGRERYYSSWIALTRSPGRAALLERQGWTDLRRFDSGARPWTDDYASVWTALAR